MSVIINADTIVGSATTDMNVVDGCTVYCTGTNASLVKVFTLTADASL